MGHSLRHGIRRSGLIFALVIVTVGLPAQPNQNAADAMQRKLEQLQQNARNKTSSTTEFTESEINAWMKSNYVALPEGVKSVRFRGSPGVIVTMARVDFDQYVADRKSSNPMLNMFKGEHDVFAIAHARGTHGEGFVDIDSVELDGVEVPRFVLQLFVDRYLKPKYPNLGLNSRFPLPARVDTASVATHKLVVVQK